VLQSNIIFCDICCFRSASLQHARHAREGGGAKTPYQVVIKFCTVVIVPDVVTHAKFGDHRFRGFGDNDDLI